MKNRAPAFHTSLILRVRDGEPLGSVAERLRQNLETGRRQQIGRLKMNKYAYTETSKSKDKPFAVNIGGDLRERGIPVGTLEMFGKQMIEHFETVTPTFAANLTTFGIEAIFNGRYVKMVVYGLCFPRKTYLSRVPDGIKRLEKEAGRVCQYFIELGTKNDFPPDLIDKANTIRVQNGLPIF